MLNRMLALALTSTLAFAAQDPPEETCREVYVEAWFLETAEGDLDGALRTYRRCVELGAAEDREIVARAWWRMGMIARARGEETVAERWLRRVVAEYGGTEAAARAAETLEAPARPGPESDAVARAREELRELLLLDDAATVSVKRLNTVFAALTPEQIAADSASLGVPLRLVLHLRGGALAHEHEEKLLDLAFLVDTPSARDALRSISVSADEPPPERLFELARRPSRELDPELVRLLVGGTDDASMAGLQQLLARSPELLVWDPTGEGAGARACRSELSTLLYNEHPVAGEVFERFLESVPRTRADLGGLSEVLLAMQKSLVLDTPASERVRAMFPELTAAGRYQHSLQIRSFEDVPRVALDLLLNDTEPQVRQNGLMWLLEQGDPAATTEMLERSRREGPDLRARLLTAAAGRSTPACSASELLAAADPGPLLEFVYRTMIWAPSASTNTLAQQGRSALDVLALGVERKDVELLEALFANSPAFQSLGPNESTTRSLATRALAGSPEREGRDGLAFRLFDWALEVPNERIRKLAIGAAAEVVGESELAALRSRALLDPSPPVRVGALGPGHLNGIRPETVRALLLDPDENVFGRTRAARPEPAVLLAALPELSGARRGEILQYFQAPGYESVVRALFDSPREGDPSWIVSGAFQYLETRDAEALVAGFVHEEPGVRQRASLQLAQLELPAEYRPHAGALDEQRRRAIHASLTENLERVADALLRWNLDRLEGKLENPTARRELALGLARLGAREELIERALDTSSQSRDVGGTGLVELGDREALRSALRASSYPGGLVPYALRLDLADECHALWEVGRIDAQSYLNGILTVGADDELVRLLLGEQVAQAGIDATTVTRVVSAAAEQGDTRALARAAERFESRAAVRALAGRNAWEVIVESLPTWKDSALEEALVELARKTGAPVEWSGYVSEHRPIQDEVRERLGLPPR